MANIYTFHVHTVANGANGHVQVMVLADELEAAEKRVISKFPNTTTIVSTNLESIKEQVINYD